MSEPPVEELSAHIDKKYRELKSLEQQARTIQLTVPLLILLVVIGYLFAIYKRAQEMYTFEKFRPAIVSAASDLQPDVRAAMEKMIAEVGPVYIEEGKKQFNDMIPAIQKQALKEWEYFSSQMQLYHDQKVDAALKRAHDKTLSRLSGHFPELATKSGQDFFFDDVKASFLSNTDGVFRDIIALYQADMDELKSLVKGFRTERWQSASNEELQRQYVHLLLMMVDRQVMGQAPSLEAGLRRND